MRAYCQCGWPVHATARAMVTCGKCGRSVLCGKRGVGDIVALALNAIGGSHLAKLYENLTGKQCGCKKRQAWLNKLGNRIAARFNRG